MYVNCILNSRRRITATSATNQHTRMTSLAVANSKTNQNSNTDSNYCFCFASNMFVNKKLNPKNNHTFQQLQQLMVYSYIQLDVRDITCEQDMFGLADNSDHSYRQHHERFA